MEALLTCKLQIRLWNRPFDQIYIFLLSSRINDGVLTSLIAGLFKLIFKKKDKLNDPSLSVINEADMLNYTRTVI